MSTYDRLLWLTCICIALYSHMKSSICAEWVRRPARFEMTKSDSYYYIYFEKLMHYKTILCLWCSSADLWWNNFITKYILRTITDGLQKYKLTEPNPNRKQVNPGEVMAHVCWYRRLFSTRLVVKDFFGAILSPAKSLVVMSSGP